MCEEVPIEIVLQVVGRHALEAHHPTLKPAVVRLDAVNVVNGSLEAFTSC